MTYLLIHGAWHGAWCWYRLAPMLEAAGHRVIAPDLPGHGADPTPANRVSMQTYSECISGILEAQPEPVVLVGHSMAGAVISRVATERPQAVATLVYLAAYLLPDGGSILAATQADSDSRIPPNLIFPDDPAQVLFRPEGLRETFYADCARADVTLAAERICPQPHSPLRSRLRLDEGRYVRVPRVYIETRQDRALTPAAQQRMLAERPCERVLSLDTGHSPFFSAPEALAEMLLGLQAGGLNGAG